MNVVEYCCPTCRGELQGDAQSYRCEACSRAYPILFGIPDFRIAPDPHADFEEDRRKAIQLIEQYPRTDFDGLLKYYWSITPATSASLASRYIRYARADIGRGRHVLSTIRHEAHVQLTGQTRLLDLGCATGGLLVAADDCEEPIGVDIALRWIIVARKRLEENGKAAQLVCCCAERLPFRAAQFDLITAVNVIEHARGQRDLIEEARRVVRPGGVFFGSTWNRLALAPEPHVRLWGVGWLPRRWMNGYVRQFRGISYDSIRLITAFGLRRLLRSTFSTRMRISLPTFSQQEQDGLSRSARRMIELYHAVRTWPLVKWLLLLFAPILQFVCFADRSAHDDHG